MSSNQSCQNLGECQFMGEGRDKRGGVIDIVYMRTVLNMKILILMRPTITCIIFALRLPSELKLYLVTCYFPLFADVIHTSCLVSHIQKFSPHTTPAGYVCPACSTTVRFQARKLCMIFSYSILLLLKNCKERPAFYDNYIYSCLFIVTDNNIY